MKKINETISVPISIGDTVLFGKFKNKRTVVKSITTNAKGDFLINGKPAFKFRIPTMQQQSTETETDPAMQESFSNYLKEEQKEEFKTGFTNEILSVLIDSNKDTINEELYEEILSENVILDEKYQTALKALDIPSKSLSRVPKKGTSVKIDANFIKLIRNPKQFTKKEALKIVGGLSNTSKMASLSTSLSPEMCRIGCKLSKVPGSVCSKCYAKEGSYVMYPGVKIAWAKRLKALYDPEWTNAFISLTRTMPYFRWHDSGDIQNLRHLTNIVAVAIGSPKTGFWLPTKESPDVKKWQSLFGKFPPNLNARVSNSNINGKLLKPRGDTTVSTVFSIYTEDFSLKDGTAIRKNSFKEIYGFQCEAYKRGGKCSSCRACWDRGVSVVSYRDHHDAQRAIDGYSKIGRWDTERTKVKLYTPDELEFKKFKEDRYTRKYMLQGIKKAYVFLKKKQPENAQIKKWEKMSDASLWNTFSNYVTHAKMEKDFPDVSSWTKTKEGKKHIVRQKWKEESFKESLDKKKKKDFSKEHQNDKKKLAKARKRMKYGRGEGT